MPESGATAVLEKLAGDVKSIFGNWTAYTTLGTFGLYFFGYLTLRFQLYGLGVVTDLNLLDERYFFAGARFFVYLVASLPIVLLLLSLFAALIYALSRFRVIRRLWAPVATWVRRPNVSVLLGILFSMLLIQRFMRQCFAFSSILLTRDLPEPAFLRYCVLAEDGGFINLYFSGIAAGVLLNAAIIYFIWHPKPGRIAHPVLTNTLAVLVVIEVLLLPINFGMIVVNRSLPRLADLATPAAPNGRDTWLVWEGHEWITYLLRDRKTGDRTLLSTPRKDLRSIEVKCEDPILDILFLNAKSPCEPGPQSRSVAP